MKAGELVAGKYQLEVRLGIGGMGEVWKAIHAGTGREFALKFMHAHVATSVTARRRFSREARISARIDHPSVIDIFDAGETEDGGLFLAMELLSGVSLADAFHAREPLSVRDLVTLMLDTTRALAAAHAVSIVHRDIKPGNIFLHKDRATGLAAAKILDFGISKLGGDSEHTKTGAVLGSPRYMSPEQTRSAADVDPRSDLWSVGVILFEGLTGTWPHEGDSFSSLVVAICTLPPASIDVAAPGLPEPLRAVVRDCLRPRDQRIASAGELADRLVAVLADPTLAELSLPRPLHPPSDAAKSVSGVRVRPPLLTTTAGVVIASTPSVAPGGAVAPPESLRATLPDRAPDLDDDDATRVRPPPSRGESSALLPAPAGAPGARKTTMVLGAHEAPPVGPAWKPSIKTIPLNAGSALHAELVRAGIAPDPSSGVAPPRAAPPFASALTPIPDPARPTPAGPVAAPPAPTMPAPIAPRSWPAPPAIAPPRGSGGKLLGVLAALLALLLAGIVSALVVVLRSPAPPAAPVAAPSASALAPASAAPPVSPPSPVDPTPTASDTAIAAPPIAPTVASSAPARPPRAPAAAPPRPGSKVKQLGSGL